MSPIISRIDLLEARMVAGEGRLGLMEQSSTERLLRIQESLGRIEHRQLEQRDPTGLGLRDYEYSVFSQWGEDGIIQFLIRQIDVEPKTFVEFGIGDYTEANTRFLLVNNNWSGLVIDSDTENIERLRRSPVFWRHGLKAVDHFVTVANINEILRSSGFTGEIGLLSIDIDGNDYWLWRAIDVINPVIVIVEYNHRFGCDKTVTVPYDETFRRGTNHPIIYFGASIQALCCLAKSKGYAFVGCDSSGVNAFFVRRDRLPNSLRELSATEGYVAGKFTETRDEHGFFIPSSAQQESDQLLSLPLVDVTKLE